MKKQTQINKIELGEIELGEVLDYEQPTKYIVESTDYKDGYDTPVLTAGKSFILGYTNETKGIYDNLPVIIFDDFTTDNKFVDFKFKVKSSAMKILRPKNELISLKFVFLAMRGLKFDAKRHKRYYLSAYQNLKIPMPLLNGKPDIQTQKQIVSILEKTETLKQKREEANKLTKDYLQSVFYEMFLNKGFEEKELSEICRTSSGGTPSRTKKEYWENGVIPWIKSGDLNKDKITAVDEFITEEGLKNSSAKYVEQNTVLIAMYGATAGKTSITKIKATTNQAVCAIVPQSQILNKIYLLYWLRSKYDYIVSLSFGGGQPNISQEVIRSLKIPLPTIKLQQKFASIVEHVDKLKEKQKQSEGEIKEIYNSLIQKAFNGS